MHSREPIFTKPFVYLTLGHFLQALGFSSMPLLPVYLGHLGASRTEIGAIMAAAAIGGLISRPLIGWSLDVWGRKPTLLIGTVLMACSMQLVALITEVGSLAYGMRFVFGIAEGALFTGYYAVAADLLPRKRRTEGLALFGISGLVPLALNPVLGQMGFGAPDLRWFFPLLGAVIAVSAFCVLKVPESKSVEAGKRLSWKEVRVGLSEGELWPVWFATIVFGGMVSMYMAFSTVAAQSKGIENPALLWLMYGGGAVGVRLFGARVPDRLGPRNLVAPALSLYVLAFITASVAESLTGVLLSGLLAGFGHGYCFPVIASLVVSRSPGTMRGSAMAMFTALWEVTALCFTPFFGTISDTYGDAFMFSLGGLCAVVGLVIWGGLEYWRGPALATDPAV